MKRAFLFSAISLMPLLQAVAQTQQGNTLTGGSIGLSYSQQKTSYAQQGVPSSGSKVIDYGINVAINRGKFFKDNWLLGYSLSVRSNHALADNNLDNNLSTYTVRINNVSTSAGIYSRRYWPVNDRFFVYAGGGITGAFTSTNSTNKHTGYYRDSLQNKFVTRNVNEAMNTGSWQVSPVGQVGVLYKLSDRIAAEVNLSSQVFTTNANQVNFGIVLLSGAGKGAFLTGTDTTSALPQTKKGRWLVGLSADVHRAYSNQESTYDNPVMTSSTETHSSVASLRLSAGKFVRTNRVVGGSIAYSVSKTNAANNSGVPTYSITVGAFVRSYVGAGRLRPFIDEAVSYDFTKQNTSTVVPRHFNLTVSGGVAYLLGDRFIVQTTLGSIAGNYTIFSSTIENYKANGFYIDVAASTLSNFTLLYTL